MKNTLRSMLLFTVAFFLTASSCKQATSDHNPCAGVMCTMMFTMITVEVVDKNGSPVTLSEAYTIRQKDNSRIPIAQDMAEGSYVILDDSYQKTLANKTESFRFIGLKDGIKVIEEDYVLGADCCHVSRQSGKARVVID